MLTEQIHPGTRVRYTGAPRHIGITRGFLNWSLLPTLPNGSVGETAGNPYPDSAPNWVDVQFPEGVLSIPLSEIEEAA